MQLVLTNIVKIYGTQPLFEPVSIVLNPNDSCAITGPNGSGKTTLLKVVMGYAKADKGELYWLLDNQTKSKLEFQDIAFASIQMNLWEDLSVSEAVKLHFTFRKAVIPDVTKEFVILFGEKMLQKKIKQLSAGWLNRLKVYLALFTEAKLILLDEPFSNMDNQSIEVMKKYIHTYTRNKILFVASNRQDEIELCSTMLCLTKTV